MKTRLATSRPTRLALLLLTLWMAFLVPVPVSGQTCEAVGWWYCANFYNPVLGFTGHCCMDCNGNEYNCWGDYYFYGVDAQYYQYGGCDINGPCT